MTEAILALRASLFDSFDALAKLSELVDRLERE